MRDARAMHIVDAARELRRPSPKVMIVHDTVYGDVLVQEARAELSNFVEHARRTRSRTETLRNELGFLRGARVHFHFSADDVLDRIFRKLDDSIVAQGMPSRESDGLISLSEQLDVLIKERGC